MHKLALAEFKHRLKAAKGNNIKYISGYDSMEGSKVTLICKEHGKFKALPAHIVKSKECCPNSANNSGVAKDHSARFHAEFKALYKNRYTIVGKYKGNRERLLIRCNKHNHEYMAIPEILRYGTKYASCMKCILAAKMDYKKVRINGKTFKVQGYEGAALKHLVNSGFCSIQDIVNFEEGVPVIDYRYKGKRKHYPDFYIPNKNMLIEVKSIYTLFSIPDNFYMTAAKASAAIDKGFKYKLMLIDYTDQSCNAEAVSIKLPKDWYDCTYSSIKKLAHI